MCDLTIASGESSLMSVVQPVSVDVVLCIFVLSAIAPEKMATVLNNLYTVRQKFFSPYILLVITMLQVLKPGGCVLFRYYSFCTTDCSILFLS